MSTNFSGSPHAKGFVAFSCNMRNWWGNPCISHMMKYTKRWESNGKKAPILWEKYNYRFPRLSPYHGFCYIFPYWGKFMGKPMHSPYAEYIIGWESDGKKAPILLEKVWLSISQTFPIPRVLLHFPVFREIYGETHTFPICWSIPQDSYRMGKKHPYYRKSMSIDFPDFLHTIGFVEFSRTVENL